MLKCPPKLCFLSFFLGGMEFVMENTGWDLTTDEKLRKRHMQFFHKREYNENVKKCEKKTLATNMDCGLMSTMKIHGVFASETSMRPQKCVQTLAIT